MRKSAHGLRGVAALATYGSRGSLAALASNAGLLAARGSENETACTFDAGHARTVAAQTAENACFIVIP